ncbi:MAG: zinc ribbon domain-containing protein [Bacillota bacterium]|nr:zinc ribbon domain-containing protein [Bacillota bacterium]
MRSIKPGRGPSMMGAMGSVFAAIFGVIWIFATISMGAPFFFPLFGIVFVVMGIVQARFHYKNATGKERYSVADIVDAEEEPDPLNRQFAGFAEEEDFLQDANAAAFCPYCGSPVAEDHLYCKKCGRALSK